MVVTVDPHILLYPFSLPIILPRRDRRPDLYSDNSLCTRLCFIRYPHPPPEKDKEEDDKDDLTLLINSTKFDIGRVTEVGSFGVGK